MGRFYGNKYDRQLTTTQIAAKFREDVKQAIKSGDLPQGLKLSIRTDYFAGGSAIRVKITASPVQILNVEKVAADERGDWLEARHLPILTDAAKLLSEQIRDMMNAYNHDGSDTMTDHFDVRFYGNVDFDHELQAAERAQIVRGVIDLMALQLVRKTNA